MPSSNNRIANESTIPLAEKLHMTTTPLLRAGVDINLLRLAEPVSIDTINIYSETDLEMKAKALATCEEKETNGRGDGRRTKDYDVPAHALNLELMWRWVRWFATES
jgi:hypothetical protein